MEHPGKRTNPGKLAADREAIRKAQQNQAHPDHPAFEAIRSIFSYLDKKIQHNYEQGQLQKDYGAPYGPRPLRTGAEEQTLPKPGDVYGAAVLGPKRKRGVPA